MCIRQVLGVLEDEECRMWGTLEEAVALADAEQARLTLAKTTDPGWLMRWFAPAALQSMCVSADELDFRTAASHKLARAAEFVPAWIPVTTLVLGENTRSAVIDLLGTGQYDALVGTESLFAQSRRLRCALRRLEVRAVVAGRVPAPAMTPIGTDSARAHSGAQA